MSWNPSELQNNIGRLLIAFNSAFLSSAAKYLVDPKGDRKKSLQALSSIDVVLVQKRLDDILSQIESELRSQSQKCMIDNQYLDKDIITISNNYFYAGCVRSKIISDVSATISQLNSLVVLARTHLSVLNKNSGLGGLLKGLFVGYTNPIDGVAHVFGKGSMQIEVSLSTQEFNTTALLVGQSIDAASNLLKVIVLDVWNSFGAHLEEHVN